MGNPNNPIPIKNLLTFIKLLFKKLFTKTYDEYPIKIKKKWNKN